MKTSILPLAAFAVLFGCLALAQTSAPPKHHVVFQLSEESGPAWSSLIVHVNNTMKALAEDGGSQVEVVFYGPGILMLKKSNAAFEERLVQLSKNGVKLVACRNAMNNRNLKTEDLFPFVSEVESGISEIVRKQESGWAYIH